MYPLDLYQKINSMYKVKLNSHLFKRKALIKCFITTKLIAFILMAMLLQVSAATYSQHVSLNFKNKPLKTVLNELQKQTGLELLYNSNSLSAKNVSVKIKNKPFKQALGDILTGHNLTYEITDNTVLIKEKSPSHQKQKTTATNMAADRQQENITGKVIDDQNNPIPGVSVYGKGTNIGTSTDEQGNYTIQVPESVTTLLF